MREESNQWCFCCGTNNPIGLKLKFHEEDGVYSTTFIAQKEHQGYDGVVHGGIVSTLLDEIMARYIYAKGFNAMTARLEVRYHHPTPILEELNISSRILNKRSNIYELISEIKLPNGKITSTGKAKVAVIGVEEVE
jgi:acyl-coenzyme A thioesterase PaaI-like protein